MDTTFNYTDFRDCFLTILEGLVNHNGLNIADEGHYRAMMSNVTDMALTGEKALAKFRSGDVRATLRALPPAGEIFADPDLAATIEQDGGL
jgi:hypothetical protein